MKVQSKKITYSSNSKELASFFLNEFDNIDDGFYITKVTVTRTELGYPIIKVESVDNTE